MSRLKTSVRRYAGGVGLRDLPGLWRRDWKRAYAVLSRDHAEEEEPKGWFRRWWYRTKNLFLDLSYKLSPPRRLLLALCLLLALLGLQTEQIEPEAGQSVQVFEHPIFLFLSVLGLVFLLILELADRILVRDELEVARQLQHDLLPQSPPALDGYEFAFSYRSANTIGGDYYDFVPLPDGRLALAIGDASGHGIAAALLMAIANATLKLAVNTNPEPIAVARMVHRALLGMGGPRAFLTLFFGLFDPVAGRLDYVCAGHPFPLLRRADAKLDRLGSGSFPLGRREKLELEPDSVVLATGDLLLLFTDGIPEALDAEGESFGFERLEEIFAKGGTAREAHDHILEELARFEGDEPPRDDRSLVVLARLSEPLLREKESR